MPVSLLTTSAINSSVCRLPFISALALPGAHQFDRLGSRSVAVRRVDDLQRTDIELSEAASASMRGFGPTSIGLMILAAAASTAPRSELSSQGCTTAVAHRRQRMAGADQGIVLFVRARFRHRDGPLLDDAATCNQSHQAPGCGGSRHLSLIAVKDRTGFDADQPASCASVCARHPRPQSGCGSSGAIIVNLGK